LNQTTRRAYDSWRLPPNMSGQLVEQWPLRKLSEVIEIQNGFAFSSRDYTEEGHFLIRIGNVQDGALNLNKPKYVSLDSKSLKFELSEGDLLTSLTGNIGRVARVEKSHLPAALNQRVARMKVSDTAIINSDFLYYFLRSDGFRNTLTASGHGTAQKNVSTKAIGEIEIPIPPLEEQQRIVSILDEVFNNIEVGKLQIQNNLNMGRDIFRSHLKQFFDSGEGKWKKEILENLGTLTSSKRIFKNEYVEQGIPFYRSKEIKELSHGKKTSVNLFISIQRYEEIKQKFDVPKKGDLLLTAVGTIGEMYIVKNDEEFYFKDGNIMWLKNFVSLEPEYLKLALTNFVEQIKSLSKGAAYNALTIQKLKQYSIPIPPLDEQTNMISLFQKMELQTRELEYNHLNKLECLDEFRQSILQRAFNGTLRTAEGFTGQS
jgi:type I restriction enzyme, S subunit